MNLLLLISCFYFQNQFMALKQNDFSLGDCLTFKTNEGEYYGFIVVETIKRKNDAKLGLTPIIIKSKKEPEKEDFLNGKVFAKEIQNWLPKVNEVGLFVFHLFEPGYTKIAVHLTRIHNIPLEFAKINIGGGTSTSLLEQFEQMLNMIPAFTQMNYKEVELIKFIK